jgi:hypothetical protein
MKARWFIPIAVLLTLRLEASDVAVRPRVVTIAINPREVTVLHLRPEFESTIRMPEEVTSVILGSPGEFKAEHNEGEPNYVYVKPITKDAAQSNLLIATKSGQHVSVQLISNGTAAQDKPVRVDFLIEYRSPRTFLIPPETPSPAVNSAAANTDHAPDIARRKPEIGLSFVIEREFEQQAEFGNPKWARWDGKQIETAVGDVRQWHNETVVSYSILNASDQPVEIVPPQIQIAGRKATKKKKQAKGVISDQLEIRDFRLSATRIEPRERADGVVVFDRPNFKQSTEKLFLQIAQADKVDQPVLIHIPFTPPIATGSE